MNKKRKLISLLTASPLAIASVALAISCGNKSNNNNTDSDSDINVSLDQGTEQSRIDNAQVGANPLASSERFDQTNESTVRLAVTFSRGGYQWNGLNDIIDAYNKTQSKTKGFLKVELLNAGSGYGGGADSVSAALSAKNKDNFYNLILNYGTVAAQLAKYNMLLSFNSLENDQNTDISNFSSAFTDNNATIQNVVNQSTYLLPFSKSTNISYYDGIVMFYIINAFKTNNALDMNDKATSDWYNELKSITGNNNGVPVTSGDNENDLGYVENLWGSVVSNASTILKDYTKKPLKISDLENYKGLLKFSKTAQQLFENSAKSDSTLHILGIDDPTSALEIAVFQQNNGDYKNSLESISLGNDGGVSVNFNGLNKEGSAVQNAARTAFNEFYDAYKNNALVLQEPGAYTSTDLVYHKYAFAIGSTAGYSHDYIQDGSNKFSYNAPSDLKGFSFSATFDEKTKLSQPSYVYFNFAGAKADSTDQVGTFGSYNNPIYKFSSYKFDSNGKYSSGTKPSNSHGLITNSEADTTALTNATTENSTELTAGSAALVILPESNYNSTELATMVQKAKDFANTESNNVVYAGTLAGASDPTKKYVAFVFKNLANPKSYKSTNYPNGTSVNPVLTKFWKSIGGTVESTKDFNSLGQNELKIMYAPTTWDGTGNVNYGYLQGPSIIGIHANEKGDTATRLFVKWFVTNQGGITDPSDSSKKLLDGLSPVKYMEVKMSYISPVSGFEDKSSSNYLDPQTFNKGKYANPMLTLSAQMFEEAALNAKDDSTATKWKLYESPAGVGSNSFRDAVAAAFKSMQKTNYSFTNFANSVQSSFSGSSQK